MDYMDAYTLYTLGFVAIATSCVIILAIISTFFAVNIRMRPLLWRYLCVQGSLLIWLCGKLFELIAPVLEIMLVQIEIQKAGAILVVPSLLLFYVALRKRMPDKKLLLGSVAAGTAILVCAAFSIVSLPRAIADYSPVCAFLIWNIFTFSQRRSIFIELSDMSIDAFMQRAEDAILIFDRSGKLADCNDSAQTLFEVARDGCPLSGFYNYIKSKADGEIDFFPPDTDDGDPTNIGLCFPDGIRYYLYSETLLKGKRDRPVATILTFHDVTEKKLILEELDKKNSRLKEINDELYNYIAVAHHLEDEKEKNRAVMEIQRTLGQSIAELLMGLEALTAALENRQDDHVRLKLSEIIENCRAIMSDIRRSVEELTSGDGGKEYDS